MSKITWDATGERKFEMGVSRGVLYVMKDASTDEPANSNYLAGVAWNGLTGFTNSPEGAEPTDLWADNIKYATLRSAETFGGTIEAYTYPDEFAECDGSAELAEGVVIGQQARKAFGLCYRTIVGNDVEGNDHGYKLHIIYGATAAPSEKAYATVNDSPEAVTFSWEVTCTPVEVEGFKPTATVVIDSRKVDAEKLAALEAKLYGSESEEAMLPLPAEIAEIFKQA